MRMRYLTVAITCMVALSTSWSAHAADPELVWTVEGLEKPESVFYDAKRDVIYVSNVSGGMMDKNGSGFIAMISPDGKMVTRQWVTGLDAPKGMTMHGDTLYVSDIDRLVAIDVESGEIAGDWSAENAQFLNDLAVDGEGRIYVSDLLTNTIHILDYRVANCNLEDVYLDMVS